MGKANALPRHADYKKGIEHDNEDVVLLKSEYFNICALQQAIYLLKDTKNRY